jgi:hypothetical protein
MFSQMGQFVTDLYDFRTWCFNKSLILLSAWFAECDHEIMEYTVYLKPKLTSNGPGIQLCQHGKIFG